MKLDRRALIGGGIVAGLSAWSGRAQQRAPGGWVEMAAAPVELTWADTPGQTTRALAYGGATPGPTLRARQGAPLRIRLVNNLAEPTTLSFPGLRAANAFAGFGGLTQGPVAPGGKLEIAFTPPDAGFNLYFPHAGAPTSRQISSGLFGAIVVEELAPPMIDLEAIVVVSDWRLDGAGQLADLGEAALGLGAGRVGERLAVNSGGAPLRLTAPPGGRVRLRLGNAATARVMAVGIEGVKSLIVAVDGQPSEAFEPLRGLVPLAPGARFELMFDMPRAAGVEPRFILRGGSLGAVPGEPDRDLVVFAAKGDPVAARPPLAGLSPNPRLPREIDLDRARRFDLTLSGGGATPLAIDGVSFVNWGAKPVFAVSRGTPVTLGLVNTTDFPQPMRLNGHVGRLLHALDDGWEPYWRDILLVPAGKTVHIAFVADNPGKWPIESASPERRAAGLAAWFQVA